jgi:hypothetical protein
MADQLNGAGPARLRNRFTNLSNGVEPPYFFGRCHQTNHRQKTGTMLANGHKKHQTSVGLSCRSYSAANMRAQATIPSSLHKSQSEDFVYAS